MKLLSSIDNYSVDQFGFYLVGKKKFYSKTEAIEEHVRTGTHPHWDFNDAVYSSYDWRVEPSESLEELYKRRAQQLREKYDYLVLWYSSGADCDNILRSFLDNGIELNECASFINYEGTHDLTDHYLNAEIHKIAAPKLKKYQETFPKLKHRIIDICEHVVDYFSHSDNIDNWKYSMNGLFSPNATVRPNLMRKIKEWQDLINQGKTVGFIWGIDKPRLHLLDKKYCFRFINIHDCAASPMWQMTRRSGEFNEFFYWTPDLPELVIKQAHTIKKYLRGATPTSQFMTKDRSGLGFIENDQGEKYWLSAFGSNTLVYPKFKFDIANDFKPGAIFFTERDSWFFKLRNDSAFKAWKKSLIGMWRSTPDYWKNDPTNPRLGFKGSISNPYFLE